MTGNDDGFTLIELIIIIVLLGILVAVAVPKYMDMRKSAEKGDANGLLGTMRSALNIYYASWLVSNRGSMQDFRDKVSIASFMKVANDSIPKSGNETLILEKSFTGLLKNSSPASITDYCQDGCRYVEFEFKSGAKLIVNYNRDNHSLSGAWTP